MCKIQTGTGNIFGSGTANSVVFQAGSQFIQYAGSNPFQKSQPASVVVFNHGSWYRYCIASGTPAFTGRTYPNLEYNPVTGNAASTSGTAALSIDTLLVTSDTLKIGMTATPGHAIKGNITIASGAVLNFVPTAAGTINLNGTVAQVINNSGTLIISANQNITLNNSNGVTLSGSGNDTLNGTLAFTSGKLSTGTSPLILGPTAVFTGVGAGKFIEGMASRIITGSGKYGWPMGQNADYLPDSVYTTSVTAAGRLNIQVLDKTITPFSGTVKGATQILKRYYHPTTDGVLNVNLDSVAVSFSATDLPTGVYASNLQVMNWNGSSWVNTTIRIDSVANIIYAKGTIGAGDYIITGPAGFLMSSNASINYGSVPTGQSKQDSVVITNTGNATLSIDSVRSTLADYTISPTSGSILAGGTSKFYITYSPTSTGVKNATVKFYHQGINGLDTVGVSGGATAIATFLAVPDSLNFGTRVKNTSLTDTIVVSNSGNIALTIDSVKSTAPEFTVLPVNGSVAASGTKKFFVTYKPTSAGAKSGNIVFYDNSTTKPDTLWVKGDVVIAPIFTASKTTFDFGAVTLGNQKMDSLAVTNTGTASLSISSALVTDTSAYSVSPANATIAVDNAQKFYVTFKSKSNGTKKASLVFTSNATEVTDTVKLSGFAGSVVTIAEARKDLNGDLIPDHSVTKDTLLINGVVTSKNLQSLGGQTAIFIQDSTAGVEVFGYGLPAQTIVIGDSVFALGTVYQYHGATEFEPLVLDSLHFGVIKHNAIIPKPKHLSLHQYVANPESYEGLFVEIDSLYKASGTWPAASSGASIYLTNKSKMDTAQLYISSSTNVAGSIEPVYPINVVAVINQYASGTTVNTGYEIEPSDSTNITRTKLTPIVTIAEARKDLNGDWIPDHSVTKDTLQISGVVTSTNLQSLGTKTAIFIQDTSAGVEIFGNSLPPVTIVVGDSVFALGTVAQYRGATEFTPLAMDTMHFGIIKHKAVVPKAKKLTLHQFVSNSESYEGLLVEIDSLYKASGTWPASGSGASIYVTNANKDTAQLYISSIPILLAGKNRHSRSMLSLSLTSIPLLRQYIIMVMKLNHLIRQILFIHQERQVLQIIKQEYLLRMNCLRIIRIHLTRARPFRSDCRAKVMSS